MRAIYVVCAVFLMGMGVVFVGAGVRAFGVRR
jgi:hypothetical protein